jgi:septal ring factor EnvC (AmiA/AmiB activator)
MRHTRRQGRVRSAVAAAALLAALGAAAVLPLSSTAQPSLDQLNSQLGQQQSRAQGLSSSIGGLSQLISSLDGQIALVQSREAIVRAELAHDRATLASVEKQLGREQQLLALLQARLARARAALSNQLVSSYENDKPDIVRVVLEAHGFKDLLEKVDFLHRAELQQKTLIKATQVAKAQADAAAKRLAALEASVRQATQSAGLRVAALAGMDSLLHSKQGALQQARAAQQSALAAARARGAQLQSEISRVQAQQAAAQAAAAQAGSAGQGQGSSGPALGPSGGWAIPYAIVLCESGGQNLPPNSAGASGYYQIIPSTWSSFGGSGPAAYLASKAEQDAVASRIWNGGAGVSNWACAAIVGIH